MNLLASPAAVRRELALLADCDRHDLAKPFSELSNEGELPRAEKLALLTSYLLDPACGAILATTDERTAWLGSSLFRWVGPANAAPVDDLVAALIVGPTLATPEGLSPLLLGARFSPRADELVAIAVAALDPSLQQAALVALHAEPGPDADVLALSLVQCGRALGWAPELLELPIAATIVDGLLARLHTGQARPAIDAAARALAPIAAHASPFAAKIRDVAASHLAALAPSSTAASFAADVLALSAPRANPGLDKWLAQPRRDVAMACAYILGFTASLDRAEFQGDQARIIDHPEADTLLRPFVDGLVEGAHAPAVAELVIDLLGGSDSQVLAALAVAARIPLDDIGDALVAELDAAVASRRVAACAAVELLENRDELDVDASLALRLGDPSPEVCAAATRTLLSRGRPDLVGKHSAREPNAVRRAVVLAGLGELTVPVIGELVTGLLANLEGDAAAASADDGDDATRSPISQLLGQALLCSVAGIETATQLIRSVPDAAALLALACAPDPELDIGILAPPEQRTELARAVIAIAEAEADSELGVLALYLLARMSAGDEAVADVIAEALTSTEGWAQNLLSALGEVRVASATTAGALAPFLAARSPLGARITAAAIAGRALPADHAAWADVRELFELGTIARTAAWTALCDRARRAVTATP